MVGGLWARSISVVVADFRCRRREVCWSARLIDLSLWAVLQLLFGHLNCWCSFGCGILRIVVISEQLQS